MTSVKKMVSVAFAASLAVSTLGALGCKKSDPEGGPAPTESASAAAPGSAAAAGSAAASAAPGKAATKGGAFEGKYTTTAITAITVPEAAKWKGEEGNDGVGEGKIAVDVAADGRVTGTVDGALGAGLVDGQLEGDVLTATIRRKDPADNGFYGTIAAKLSGDKGEGTLNVSRGNAGLVREGKLTLAKK